MKAQMTFEEYLEQEGLARSTVKSYMYVMDHFLVIHPQADEYKYRDILNHLEKETKDYKNSETKGRILGAIKRYYDYLIVIGKRQDHPCRTLFIRANRNRGVIHTDLFSSGELAMLMHREERYAALKLKNQVLCSLLIYQGLATGEILRMKVQDVDLDKGTIYVRGSRKTTSRHLEIHPKQYRIFDRYIFDSRPELLQCETDQLLIGKLGTPITVDDVTYIVSTFKPLFPDRNLNPKTIRQSVIANWLNEKGLPVEQVQLLAGHKWVSTTIRYKHEPPNEQRELINKFHPLG